MKNSIIKKLIVLVLSACFIFTAFGCSSNTNDVYVTSVTSSGSNALGENVFTVNYSDGSSDTFTVKNGMNGQNGQDLSIDEVYQKYCEEVENISYAEFLAIYMGELSINTSEDLSRSIAKNLTSSLMLYAEFYETTTSTNPFTGKVTTSTALGISSGSAVVYKITSDAVYVITNYHVVFSPYADTSLDVNQISHKINGYFYGAEDDPVPTQQKDEIGCTINDYGNFAVSFEYVGGSIRHDIAMLKASKESVLKVSPKVSAVTFANDYNVGETVVAIGDMESMGISATKGMVSIEKEQVSLAIDGTKRSYLVLRTDVAINHGNSGGGLFNAKGELVGITNGGHTNGTSSNDKDITTAINYALPCDIIKEVADNMYYYEMDGDLSTKGAYVPKLGITVIGGNPYYDYDESTGDGVCKEKIVVNEVTEGALADGKLLENDVLISVVVDNKTFTLNRNFDIGTALLAVRPNSTVVFNYERNSENGSWTQVFTSSMISAVE